MKIKIRSIMGSHERHKGLLTCFNQMELSLNEKIKNMDFGYSIDYFLFMIVFSDAHYDPNNIEVDNKIRRGSYQDDATGLKIKYLLLNTYIDVGYSDADDLKEIIKSFKNYLTKTSPQRIPSGFRRL